MATAAPGARRSQAIPTTTSIVEDHGSYASSCGYCDRKGPTSKSHGMHAHVCSVEDYQSLLDRGWRRSGCWMYRPHLNDTCCPPFTIRLDACAFAPSKSQRKVEKRWRRYLDGELDDDGKRVDDGDKDESRGGERLGADASGVSASASLADRDAEAMHAETRDADATRTNETTATKKTKRAFEIREAPSAFDEEEYRLWRRYQASVHGDDEGSLSEASYRRFLVDTPLRLTNAPIREPEDDETQGGWVEWPGYKGGRTKKKAPAFSSDAGSRPRMVPPPPRGFGSFHHQYRVDGRLVAVGVVDVLPKCLSSKYFFWEPSFAWASLGKLGALREIEWVRRAANESDTLRHYYLGYYIHDCPKMRYKAEYAPAELKCAVTGRWTPLDDPETQRRLAGAFAPLRAPANDASDDDDDASDAAAAAAAATRANEATVTTETVTLEPSEPSEPLEPSEPFAESIARDVPIGVVAGGQILSVAPLARARRGPLGGAAGAALARRVETLRRATGDAGDAMVYLVDLERVAPKESRASGGGGGARFSVVASDDDASDDDASDDDASDVS